MLKKLSIVVPVFNEEDNVQQLFNEISETVGKLDIDYEIIFVDDGSTDLTASRLTFFIHPAPSLMSMA